MIYTDSHKNSQLIFDKGQKDVLLREKTVFSTDDGRIPRHSPTK